MGTLCHFKGEAKTLFETLDSVEESSILVVGCNYAALAAGVKGMQGPVEVGRGRGDSVTSKEQLTLFEMCNRVVQALP